MTDMSIMDKLKITKKNINQIKRIRIARNTKILG